MSCAVCASEGASIRLIRKYLSKILNVFVKIAKCICFNEDEDFRRILILSCAVCASEGASIRLIFLGCRKYTLPTNLSGLSSPSAGWYHHYEKCKKGNHVYKGYAGIGNVAHVYYTLYRGCPHIMSAAGGGVKQMLANACKC